MPEPRDHQANLDAAALVRAYVHDSDDERDAVLDRPGYDSGLVAQVLACTLAGMLNAGGRAEQRLAEWEEHAGPPLPHRVPRDTTPPGWQPGDDARDAVALILAQAEGNDLAALTILSHSHLFGVAVTIAGIAVDLHQRLDPGGDIEQHLAGWREGGNMLDSQG
ncbi:MAG: hypothetical protein ACYCVZ_00735 [Streptosporangiaceae bacterium]